MNLARNTFTVLLTSLLLVPLGLVRGVVLARYLDLDSRGIFAAVMTFSGLAVVLLRFGWPTAAIQRLRRNKTPAAAVTGGALLALGLFSSVFALACLPMATELRHRLLADSGHAVFLVSIALVPFQLAGEFFTGVARGLNRFDYFNRYRLARDVGRVGALALVLVFWDGSLLDALVAVLVVHALTSAALVAQVVRITRLARPKASEVWATLIFGLKTHIQGLAGDLHERIDIFMLIFLLGEPAQVALYSVAVGVVNLLKLLSFSVASALFPRISGEGDADAARLSALANRQSLAWLAILGGGLALIAPKLFPILYGADYSGSVKAFLLLLPGVVMLTIYRILSRYFTAIGRQRINILTQTLSTCVNVAANFWLIPRHGIAGAAMASLISYSLEGTLILVAFCRATGLRARDSLLPTFGDFAYYRQGLALLRGKR